MGSENGWGRPLTKTMLTNIKRTLLECLINGDCLVRDAYVLFRDQRKHRAASLAILGIEELGKAYLLKMIHDEHESGTWNEGNFKKLVSHKHKQEVAFDLIGVAPMVDACIFGGQDNLLEMQELLVKTRKFIGSKGVLDRERQDLQFVTVNPDCTCKVPSHVPEERCRDVLRVAKMVLSKIRVSILSPEFMLECEGLKLNLSEDLRQLQPDSDDYFALGEATDFQFKR